MREYEVLATPVAPMGEAGALRLTLWAESPEEALQRAVDKIVEADGFPFDEARGTEYGLTLLEDGLPTGAIATAALGMRTPDDSRGP